MAGESSQCPWRGDLLIGFLGGVLAVAVFHQLAVLACAYVGLGEGEVYSFRPTRPLGVPRFMSLMFWGGVWGIVFAAVIERLPVRLPPVVAGLLFGWCGPAVFGWTVVAALRGAPLFGGFIPAQMLSSMLINGMFGIGLALIFTWLRQRLRGRPPSV